MRRAVWLHGDGTEEDRAQLENLEEWQIESQKPQRIYKKYW